MKKILYYTAQAMLLLCSLMLGFVTDLQLMIPCISSLICGFLLMLVYTLQSRKNWIAFFLYTTVVFCHAFYLTVSMSIAPVMLALMAVMMLCSAAVLVFEVKKGIPCRDTFEDVLFTKAALIPEVLLNMLMNRTSHDGMFSTFSWVLLALTSAWAIAAIARLMQEKRMDLSKAIAAGLLQFCFFTDILSCIYLLIYTIRNPLVQNEAAPASSILKSSAFSGSKGRHAKSASAAFTKKKK